MVAEVQGPVLHHLGALVVPLQHCNLEGVEAFPVHVLDEPDVLQVLDDLDVPVGSSVVQESVVAVVALVVSLDVLEEVEEALVLVVSDGCHQRGPAVVVGLGRVPLLQQQLQDLLLPVARSQVEDVHAFPGLHLFLDQAVLDHELDAVRVLLNDGVMQGSQPLVTLEVYVVRVPDLIQNKLDVLGSAELSSQHQRREFLLVDLLQVGSGLDKHIELFAVLQHRSIVDGFAALTVADTEIGDVLEDEGQQFGVGVDGGAVDRRAEVGRVGLLYHRCLLEVHVEFTAREGLGVQWRVAEGRRVQVLLQHLLEEQGSKGLVAAPDYAGDVHKDLSLQLRLDLDHQAVDLDALLPVGETLQNPLQPHHLPPGLLRGLEGVLDESVDAFLLALGDVVLLGPDRVVAVFQPRDSVPAEGEGVVPNFSSLQDLSQHFDFPCSDGGENDIIVVLYAEVFVEVDELPNEHVFALQEVLF